MSRLLPPSHFVAPPIMGEKPMGEKPSSEFSSTPLGFPNEFPYEFNSTSFSPGFTSPGDSTETEDENSDDEEDFLAGLTRRLAPSAQRFCIPPSFNTKPEEKRQVAATSPQSTLSGLGSFSNSRSGSPSLLPSPVATSSFRRDDAWEVISAVAGEVARLKLENYENHTSHQNHSPILRRENAKYHTDHYLQQQRLLEKLWLCSQSRIKPSENLVPKRVVNDEVTFENLRYMKHNALSNATWVPQHSRTPLKRPSAGTGVFLPRRYPTATPSDSLKRPVIVNTTAMLQSKVNPKHNPNFDEVANVGSRRNRFDYECMLARRNLLARHGNFRAAVGGVGCLNQERPLPQDWMY